MIFLRFLQITFLALITHIAQLAELKPFRAACQANQPYIVKGGSEQVCLCLCVCVCVLAMLWDNMLDTYKKLT